MVEWQNGILLRYIHDTYLIYPAIFMVHTDDADDDADDTDGF